MQTEGIPDDFENQDSIKADHVIRTVIWYWNCKALSFLMLCKESVYWKHCECLTSSVWGDVRSSYALLKVKGTVLYVNIVILMLVTIFKQNVCDLDDFYIKTLLLFKIHKLLGNLSWFNYLCLVAFKTLGSVSF